MAHHELPEGTHTVELVFTDNHGVLRGKRIPATQWARVAECGVAASSAGLIWGVRCELRDESPAGGMAEGFPDMTLVPIPGELRAVPWKPGTAQVLVDLRTAEGDPHPLSARNALKGVLASAEELGYTVKAALEMEFYLVEAASGLPRGTEVNVYGIADPAGYGPVMQEIQTRLVEFGIPIEAWNYEYAPGQFEVNLRYDDALRAADDAVLLRGAVKEIALQCGFIATFMGKPFEELSGSGLHVHQSLWKDGENAFDESGSLSPLGLQYVAGLQKRIRELSLLGSPSLNDYKRRRDGSFCPTRETWGDDNRTVAIRVITAGSVRIEQRDAAGPANPYLLLAGQIAAGLDGIRSELTPPAKCEGNSYTDERFQLLPRTALEAIDLLDTSEFARSVLPAALVDIYVDTARFEYGVLTDPVSQIERDRFIGVI